MGGGVRNFMNFNYLIILLKYYFVIIVIILF